MVDVDQEMVARIRTLANPGVHWQMGIGAAAQAMMEMAGRPGFRQAMESLQAKEPIAYADAVALVWSQIGAGADLPPGEGFWQALEQRRA